MLIPKSFRIGHTKYSVCMEPRLRGGAVGRILYFCGWGLVRIATHTHSGKPRAPACVEETFLHEITHGILHHMGHKLRDDETFVTEFSKRLHQIIRTAELP